MNVPLFIVTFFLLCALAGCSDFIEKDIEGQKVSLQSPANGYTSSSFQVTFRWNALLGAREYELMVVTPSFDSMMLVRADTTVTGNDLTLTLSPGTYQWKVTAVNNAGQSLPSDPYMIHIDSVGSLSDVNVNLYAPADGSHSDQTVQTFSWMPVANAQDYRFQLLDSNGAVVFDQTQTATEIDLTLPGEGSYEWRVRAQNNFSNSGYSARQLTIDSSAPGPPVLVEPLNGDSVSLPYTLRWSRDQSEPNPFKDSVFVFADSTLADLVFSAFVADTSQTLTVGTSGQTYRWLVKSVDKAGNQSADSEIRKFIVGP